MLQVVPDRASLMRIFQTLSADHADYITTRQVAVFMSESSNHLFNWFVQKH